MSEVSLRIKVLQHANCCEYICCAVEQCLWQISSLHRSAEHVNCLDIHIEDNHVNNVAGDAPASNAASDAVADDAFFCLHK